MTDIVQPALPIGTPHNNQYLFSDHYLEQILRRDRTVWDVAIPEATAFLAWLRELHGREGANLAAYSESQLEDHWFKPIFDRLGHSWEGQATVPGLEQTIKKPDFVFFPDDAARQAAVSDQRTEAYAHHALAVGEVKAWDVNLSKKLGGAAVFDNNNPMFQIDYYVKAMGLDWGIVSNGRLWRLVHKDSSYKLDIYFEVDLFEALTTPDERHAQAIATYFWVFFRQAAFLPGEDGRVFLDDVLAGSRRYAVALESDLRDNAYKALEQLILGFFAPAANGLDPEDAADREQVYRNSLLLLYRLLFLFYGESRGLLPMRNPAYHDRSLTRLADSMSVDVENSRDHPPMTREYWDRLQRLFRLISGVEPDLNDYLGVPRYNGGLFDATRHPFLETHFVGDRFLVRAIDYLARRRISQNGRYAGRERVDYRTLGVRQLGSIYEGLLEYRVSQAEETMVTVRKGGKETWIPATERGRSTALETRQPGDLYLATDKGERKATGSYYTPDYIVKYIVEQTLGPLVEEARERVKAQVTEANPRDEAARQALGARLFEEAILALNVLDPAMGSGHFLVDATNYLARALATDEFTQAAHDGTDEADLTYWQRRVVEACIYGVDKNELAVELAKLSLWLVTVSGDKPLSFLDHHLRHGDSLIGAWLKDLDAPPKPSRPDRSEPGTDPLFDESAFTTSAGLAVAGVATIEGLPTETIDDVHAKEDTWRQIHDTHLARWRRLADLWVSAWFGNEMSAEEYADLARRIQGRGGALLSDDQAARYLDHPAVTDNDYFHWELAFPEVFFDEFGRPKGEAAGFDAVVGNPPYVRQESLDETVKSILQDSYVEVFHGTADLYVYFLALASQLLRVSGLFGYICSSQFRKLAYGAGLRRFLTEASTIREIVDFGTRQVFDDATTYPIILIAEKGRPTKHHMSRLVDAGTQNATDLASLSSRLVALPTGEDQWVFATAGLQDIVSGSAKFLTLDTLLSDSINRGITTGFNDAFVIDRVTYQRLVKEDPNSTRLIKPYIRGEDLHSWYQDRPDLFLIFSRRGTNLSEYPAIEIYLSQFKELLEPKPLDWDNSLPWKGRKSGNYQWYEIQDSVDYFQTFERPRIHSTKVSLAPSFSLVENTLYASNTSYVLPTYDRQIGLFLLSVLNSALSHYYSRIVFAAKANGYYEVQPERLSAFPVPIAWDSLHLTDTDEVFTECEGLYPRQSLEDMLGWELLAYLAEQMITLHKDKQALVADFWTDLEGAAADTPTFARLRDKGKQEASLAKEAAARPFVDADSRSTRTLDESLGWDEAAFKAFVRLLAGSVSHLSALTRVYNDHAPRYRDLVQRIERTDWLIDQIVYKLYGLTEEEIAIVEGRTQ
jgi:type I restriction-modification system DNA methylase subunit